MNRAKYTTTTTGTGNCSLTAANGFVNATDFQLTEVGGFGGYENYFLIDANGTDWEFGLAAVSHGPSTTLNRSDATVLESTNSRNRINLSAGAHTVLFTKGSLQGKIASYAFRHDNLVVPSEDYANMNLESFKLVGSANPTTSFDGLWTYFGATVPTLPDNGPTVDPIAGVANYSFQAYRLMLLVPMPQGHYSGSLTASITKNASSGTFPVFSNSMLWTSANDMGNNTTLVVPTPWFHNQTLDLDGSVPSWWSEGSTNTSFDIELYNSDTSSATMSPSLVVELMF